MGLTKRKIILPLVFLLVILSLLRVLKVAISSSPFSSTRLVLNTVVPPTIRLKPIRDTVLTQKEIQFLYDIILQKSPCNLLVFGLEEQYLKLPTVNGGGSTVFLEDRPEKLKKTKGGANGKWVYRVEYKTYAKNAYKLLKHARSHSSCYPHSGITTIVSKCKLALTELPEDVLKTKWDVIVVDGPDGDGPESPGRMGSIFMAGALARAGNRTNVVVHDVDRMIEKWFSWEFLCEENLVSSKGRFWNFRIPRKINNHSSKFCSV
ncbi:probable methyltransferase At1g27930 [Cynara cardunculus var. scolymus]|uniref:Putative polysaccharide biosynthesis protein n=1 Tax=Cynara cardunculus var. scolymus TaxID=59895 RepID=A0A103XXY9_CYNCS|nr:probable methyltransferase At1g27930 [Cynara cardunculus var. scolymus]KVH99003.1 putative polysaccharide biosynthesis protein [Cynara cardunculus var. scolymus]